MGRELKRMTWPLWTLCAGILAAACSEDPRATSPVGGSAGTAAAAGTNAPAGPAGPAGQGAGAGTGAASSAGGASGSRVPGGTTAPGTAGLGAGGAGAMAPAADGGDAFVSGVTVAVHEEVSTILVVTWMQAMPSESTWLEFSFEQGNVLESRPKPGTAGMHRDVVLGVPGATAASIRIVNKQGGQALKTREYMGMTGAIPTRMPKPAVSMYNAERASPDRYLFGAVEDSDGGCANQSCYYHTTFWLYVMDRKGRIVWYYAEPASNATSSFQRIARDGEYIWIEKRPFGGRGDRSVLKRTLDGEYSEEFPVQGLADCIDVTDDGSLLYDVTGTYELRERTRAGQTRTIWSCRTHFGERFQCYSNTINWNPATDSILLSFVEHNTVIEIDRKTGAVVGQYGDAEGSYAFMPPMWGFEFQHFPNITKDGTLLVSSHMPGNSETERPVAGQHAFMEFTIDRQSKTLIEKWVYNEGPEWAMYKGMAIRLPNGNTLANYGTGGVIREITPDKQTVFYVKFDAMAGNDFFNKMVGHNVLIDDLYALNGGPKQ